jgi:hypothetical protein
MPLTLVGILGLMIVPLPSLALDFLLAVNVTISLVILLTAVQVTRPLDFSVFPSLLLITTLFRLSLNVATTRLILLGAPTAPTPPARSSAPSASSSSAAATSSASWSSSSSRSSTSSSSRAAPAASPR